MLDEDGQKDWQIEIAFCCPILLMMTVCCASLVHLSPPSRVACADGPKIA